MEKTYLQLHVGLAKDNLPSAVFTGHAGTGKTHLARALGFAACQKGLSVLFITAAEMVNHLRLALEDLE
jgi:DNA replication protein DnaC